MFVHILNPNNQIYFLFKLILDKNIVECRNVHFPPFFSFSLSHCQEEEPAGKVWTRVDLFSHAHVSEHSRNEDSVHGTDGTVFHDSGQWMHMIKSNNQN